MGPNLALTVSLGAEQTGRYQHFDASLDAEVLRAVCSYRTTCRQMPCFFWVGSAWFHVAQVLTNPCRFDWQSFSRLNPSGGFLAARENWTEAMRLCEQVLKKGPEVKAGATVKPLHPKPHGLWV